MGYFEEMQKLDQDDNLDQVRDLVQKWRDEADGMVKSGYIAIHYLRQCANELEELL